MLHKWVPISDETSCWLWWGVRGSPTMMACLQALDASTLVTPEGGMLAEPISPSWCRYSCTHSNNQSGLSAWSCVRRRCVLAPCSRCDVGAWVMASKTLTIPGATCLQVQYQSTLNRPLPSSVLAKPRVVRAFKFLLAALCAAVPASTGRNGPGQHVGLVQPCQGRLADMQNTLSAVRSGYALQSACLSMTDLAAGRFSSENEEGLGRLYQGANFSFTRVRARGRGLGGGMLGWGRDAVSLKRQVSRAYPDLAKSTMPWRQNRQRFSNAMREQNGDGIQEHVRAAPETWADLVALRLTPSTQARWMSTMPPCLPASMLSRHIGLALVSEPDAEPPFVHPCC